MLYLLKYGGLPIILFLLVSAAAQPSERIKTLSAAQQGERSGERKVDAGKKRQKEKDILAYMIRTYCRRKHATKGGLCNDCRELQEYAFTRVDRCPLMQTKTFCSVCETHCYSPEMRSGIKAVIRYSGPGMIFSHPFTALKHMFITFSSLLKR